MNFDYSLSAAFLFGVPAHNQEAVQTQARQEVLNRVLNNATEHAATQEDLDRVLNLLSEEVDKMEIRLRHLPPQSYRRCLLLVREKMLVLADQLTQAFHAGETTLNLRIRSQRAVAEIRACENICYALPSELREKNALIDKKIEALNLDSGPVPKFSFPDQKNLQECIQDHLFEDTRPYLDEKGIPVKVAELFQQSVQTQEELVVGVDQVLKELPLSARRAIGMHLVDTLQECAMPPAIQEPPKEKKEMACTKEDVAQLQATFALAQMGSLESMSPIHQVPDLYQGPCKQEYLSIERGVAIQSKAIPLIALAKIEHAIGEFVVREVKHYCNLDPQNRRICEKSALLMVEAVEWTKAHVPESLKAIVRKAGKVAEDVAEDLEANYFVPKEFTNEAFSGARMIGELMLFQRATKATFALSKFWPKSTVKDSLLDLPKTLLLIDKANAQAKVAFAAKETMRDSGRLLDLPPPKLPPLEQILSLEGKASKSLPLILPAPISQSEVRAIGGINQRSYRQFKMKGKPIISIPPEAIPKHLDVYFHTTSELNAYNILKLRKIKRLDHNLFLGAFVASRPETRYGEFVFALNRNIENSSKVLNAEFDRHEASHWAGFSKSIPVTQDTLEYIAIHDVILEYTALKRHVSVAKSIEIFAERFSSLAGRQITVLPLKPRSKLAKHRTKHDGVFVPEKWPLTLELEVGD